MRHTIWLALLALLFNLTACGGKQTKAPQAGTAPTSGTAPAAPPAAGSAPSSAPAAASAAGSGKAAFKDRLATLDQFAYDLTGLSATPAGQAYQGWLLSDDGTRLLSIGVLKLRPDGGVTGEYNSPSSENLLDRYAAFQVTLEPAAGSAQPSAKVVLKGGLAGDSLTRGRRLFSRNQGQPATPLNTAYGLGLQSQAMVAVQHIENAANSAAIGSMPGAHGHLEHVVNILEGNGPRFGDHDGNGAAENPGDGFGARAYALQIEALSGGAAPVAAAAKDLLAQIAAIQEKSLAIIKVNDAKAATAQLNEVKALSEKLKSQAIPALYAAAQALLTFEVKAAN